ncbi:MAG: hypothetical protein ACM3X3_02325 [Betaproteobacteria bacterium]
MVPAEARPMVRRESRRSARATAGRRTAAVRRPRRAGAVDAIPAAKAVPGKKANLGRITFVAVVATGLLLGNLALRATAINSGYRLSKLEETLAATQTEYDRLSLAIANLQSLERIEETARVRLGMVDPASAEFVVVAPAPSGQVGGASVAAGERPSEVARLERGFATRAGNVLIGLVSPFVARWFYDVPDQEHPRVHVAAR